jgi:hypothetical protein
MGIPTICLPREALAQQQFEPHLVGKQSWLQINQGTVQFQHFHMQFESCKIRTRLSTMRRDMAL